MKFRVLLVAFMIVSLCMATSGGIAFAVEANAGTSGVIDNAYGVDQQGNHAVQKNKNGKKQKKSAKSAQVKKDKKQKKAAAQKKTGKKAKKAPTV